MSSYEKSPEGPGRLMRFYKKFNKVSAAVFASAGIIFDSGALLGLAAIDVAQAYGAGRLEKWRSRQKAGKQAGSLALKNS